MKIVEEVLIAWDPETQQSNKDKSVFKLTIDGWTKAGSRELNKCRRRLFCPDGSLNTNALEDFRAYVDNIMSASYPGFEIMSCCSDNCEGKIEELDLQVQRVYSLLHFLCPLNSYPVSALQTLRDARHGDHCDTVKGKVLTCNKCDTTFTTQDLVMMNLNHWRRSSKSDGSLDEPLTWSHLAGRYCCQIPLQKLRRGSQ